MIEQTMQTMQTGFLAEMLAFLDPYVKEAAAGAGAAVTAGILLLFKRVRAVLGRAVKSAVGKGAAPVLAAAVLVMTLSACGTIGGAGSGLFNEQDNAGMTDWHVEFNKDGSLSEVRVIDGKEKQNVRLKADIKNGTVDYSATGIKAFAAFETRGDVEKWVASRWPEIAPDIRAGITDVIGFLTGL